MSATEKEVQVAEVRVGDRLPAHRDNIIHTEDVTETDDGYGDPRRAVLRIWYYA